MLEYLPKALKVQHSRDHYEEFLRLFLIFLSGKRENKSFQAPGPTHHAQLEKSFIHSKFSFSLTSVS